MPDFEYCRNFLLADSTKHHALNLRVSTESAPNGIDLIIKHTKLLLVQSQHKLHNMFPKLFSTSQTRE